MVILIDANNLIGQPAARISHAQRRALSLRLARYAASSGHTLFLVFDGGSSFVTTRVTDRLTNVTAGPNQTADTAIITLSTQHPAENLVIITRDRMLRIHAKQRSIASLTPEQFMERVSLREQKQPTKKTTPPALIRYSESPSEIDLIMQQAAEEPIPNKDLHEDPSRERAAHTQSQQEKARESLLNKL